MLNESNELTYAEHKNAKDKELAHAIVDEITRNHSIETQNLLTRVVDVIFDRLLEQDLKG